MIADAEERYRESRNSTNRRWDELPDVLAMRGHNDAKVIVLLRLIAIELRTARLRNEWLGK